MSHFSAVSTSKNFGTEIFVKTSTEASRLDHTIIMIHSDRGFLQTCRLFGVTPNCSDMAERRGGRLNTIRHLTLVSIFFTSKVTSVSYRQDGQQTLQSKTLNMFKAQLLGLHSNQQSNSRNSDVSHSPHEQLKVVLLRLKLSI